MQAWDGRLYDASYKDLDLIVRVVADEQARDIVEAKPPYRDGARQEDMGRGARQVSLTAVIMGGGYLDALEFLLATLNEPESGELVHPIYGPINAICRRWRTRYDPANVNTVEVEMEFVEDAQDLPGIAVRQTAVGAEGEARSKTGLVASLLDGEQRAKYVATVNNALATLRSPDRVIPELREAQRALQDFQSVSSELVTTIRVLREPENQPIIRAIKDTNAAMVRLYREVVSDAPPYRDYTLDRAQTLRQVARTLYGDHTKAEDIAGINDLSPGALLPAGTTLRVRA